MPRFCPTAPGSTIFKYPSSIYNPGPGTYYQSFKWNEFGLLEKTRQAYDDNKHSELVVKPQSRAPSIPSKKVPQTAYSGLGHDTVGPAAYNPSSEQVKTRMMKTDFISSKSQRKVFEPNRMRENTMPSKDNPGPGHYESLNPTEERKDFNAQGQNAIFLSKVPNCKDLKTKQPDNLGPGSYETNPGNQSMMSDGHRRINSDAAESQMNSTSYSFMGNRTNKNFLSTTKREKDFWINKIETPYTHPTHFVNPGPGKYNHEKKRDDIKTRLLVEETVHIPFGSSEERGCMKRGQQKQVVPGPGSYIDINNPLFSSVSKPLLKFSSDRTFAEAHGIKLGAFGTN